MNERTKKKALATLDNMADMVRRERLIHGDYVSDAIDPEFSDAICGGHRMCLLGTAWVGYGIKPEGYGRTWIDGFRLPGVGEHQRGRFLRNRPALRAVYKALNEAAVRKVRRMGADAPIRLSDEDEAWVTTWQDYFDSPAEALFEGGKLGRDEVLRLIASARRALTAA